jgi:hypothetical protein
MYTIPPQIFSLSELPSLVSNALGLGLQDTAAGALGVGRGRGGLILAAELLEGLALGLGDEAGGNDTEQHEEGVNLKNVVHPGGVSAVLSTLGTQSSDGTLANDGTDLARGGRDTVRGRTVAGREDLTRNDEGCGVGTKVEEELGQDVDGEQTVLGVNRDIVVSETHDTEQNGKDDETHELDSLATKGIDGSDGNPVGRMC